MNHRDLAEYATPRAQTQGTRFPPEVMARRGMINSTRTVHCYECPATYTATADVSLRASELEWMGMGWCRFNCGWYCPACVPVHVEYLRRRAEDSNIHINLRANGSQVEARSIGEIEHALAEPEVGPEEPIPTIGEHDDQ